MRLPPLPTLPKPDGSIYGPDSDPDKGAAHLPSKMRAYAQAYGIACARAALEEAAKEFDRRAPPGTGFYLPEEPAEIIRAIKIEGETP